MLEKQAVYEEVQRLEQQCTDICRYLWAHPETGGNEKLSVEYLTGILEQEGFRVKKGNAPEYASAVRNGSRPEYASAVKNGSGPEYAFLAEYGSGGPVIAVLAEYDALPGLSQKACAVREPVEAGGPGHGCGHNLLGAASVTGAIAVKRYLEKSGIAGTVRLYGCPEEEVLSGKVRMAAAHMFDGCDLAVSWHPGSVNSVYDGGYLANVSAKFFFKGQTSHAAFAPERGRSALDAVELMNVGANYLREHVIDKARIHYTTDSGGFAPNIVPDHASAWYFVRAPHMYQVKEILERLDKIAQGAALMTETKSEMQVGYGCYEMKENHAFADLCYANLKEAGTIRYTPEELAFAKELQDTLDPAVVKEEEKMYRRGPVLMADFVAHRDFWERVPLTASSDSGDVSQIVPMGLLNTTCWPAGCSPHTWQASAACGSTLGEKGALHAARSIAGIVCDLLNQPEVVEKIRKEFEEARGQEYQPVCG